MASVFEVGAYEADPLVIAGAGSADEGLISRISFEDPSRLRPIANDLAHLLILACRLDAVRNQGGGAGDVEPFLRSLEDEAMPVGAVHEWRLYASIALDSA